MRTRNCNCKKKKFTSKSLIEIFAAGDWMYYFEKNAIS